MIKKVLIALPALICIILFLVWSKSSPVDQNNTVQPVDEPSGITLLASTIKVDPPIERQVERLLAVDAPIRSVFVYAITDLVDKNGYYYVSVAGLPIGSTKMFLGDALWLGSVQLAKMPGLPGFVTELMASQQTEKTIQVKQTIGGGAGNILPFRSGTQAQYGMSAVHNCGFSLNGWKAVDFFPSEDMVYSSMAGEVNYVCRDTTQVALRIGDNLYTHLVDNGAQVGDQYTQGQAISGMVPGTFTNSCGVADQGESQYHVHFCFQPDPTGFFHADGYALNTATGTWTKGQDQVNPLGYLTADWQDATIIPGPAAGANVWDSTVNGVTSMVNHTADALPQHVDLKMADTVLGNVGPAFDLMYTVILANFDLTIPLWVIGIITTLELVRIAYAGWMWVKRAIPIIG